MKKDYYFPHEIRTRNDEAVMENDYPYSSERNYYRYTLRPREVLAKVSFAF